MTPFDPHAPKAQTPEQKASNIRCPDFPAGNASHEKLAFSMTNQHGTSMGEVTRLWKDKLSRVGGGS